MILFTYLNKPFWTLAQRVALELKEDQSQQYGLQGGGGAEQLFHESATAHATEPVQDCNARDCSASRGVDGFLNNIPPCTSYLKVRL